MSCRILFDSGSFDYYSLLIISLLITMSWNNILGKRGEELAVRFLEKKNYKILEKNWRYRRAELDIIAKDGEALVFVEVKTKSNNQFGEPESAVDEKKENLMASAGAAYMRKIGHEWEIRFDIVSIIYTNENDYHIKHFEDAFFPNRDF